MGSIRQVEFCDPRVGSDEVELEALAGASMAGLRHKVRHNLYKTACPALARGLAAFLLNDSLSGKS